MFDVEREKRKRRIQKDSDGQLQQTERAFANWCASDKCRSRSSFTAPKLTIGYAASQRFCFAPVISLNDLNLNLIEAQSLNGLPGANRRATNVLKFSIELVSC